MAPRALKPMSVLPLLPKLSRQYGGRSVRIGPAFLSGAKRNPDITAVDLRPAGPDLVVRHNLFRHGLSDDVVVMLTVLKRFALKSNFPLQTFNRQSGAGFHDSRIGKRKGSATKKHRNH